MLDKFKTAQITKKQLVNIKGGAAPSNSKDIKEHKTGDRYKDFRPCFGPDCVRGGEDEEIQN